MVVRASPLKNKRSSTQNTAQITVSKKNTHKLINLQSSSFIHMDFSDKWLYPQKTTFYGNNDHDPSEVGISLNFSGTKPLFIVIIIIMITIENR
jgi:hypothetical protein